MCNLMGFIKRMLPFAVTFAVGLFIASFFVNVTAPSFRGHRGKRFHEMKRLRVENEELRNENLRLKSELESRRGHGELMRHLDHEWTTAPSVEMPVPLPPPPPAAPRVRR